MAADAAAAAKEADGGSSFSEVSEVDAEEEKAHEEDAEDEDEEEEDDGGPSSRHPPFPPMVYTSTFDVLHKNSVLPSVDPIANILRFMSVLHALRHLTPSSFLLRILRKVLVFDTRTLRHWRGMASLHSASAAMQNEESFRQTSQKQASVISREITQEEGERLDAPAATGAQLSDDPSVCTPWQVSSLVDGVDTANAYDQLLRRASLPDFIYLLQVLTFHRDSVGGLTTFARLVRYVLITRQREMHPTLSQLAKIAECYGKLDLLAGRELETLVEQAAGLTQLPTLEAWTTGLADRERRVFFQRILTPTTAHAASYHQFPYTDPTVPYTHLAAAQKQSIQLMAMQPKERCAFDLLALIFRHFTKCVTPGHLSTRSPSTPESKTSTKPRPAWLWRHSADRRAPIQVARALAEVYMHLMDHPAELKKFVGSTLGANGGTSGLHRHFDFLNRLTSFAHGLILIECETYEWAVRFLARMIEWMQSQYVLGPSPTNPNETVLVPIHGSSFYSRHMKVCHRLHQVSLALFIRSRALRRLEAQGSTRPIYDDLFTTAAEDDASRRLAPNLNFRADFRQHFQDARHAGTMRVSSFQMMVYRLLADPQGPFAFRQRVMHDEFSFYPGDSLLVPASSSSSADGEDLGATAEYEEVMRRASLTDTSSTSSSSSSHAPAAHGHAATDVLVPMSPPVEFFVEHRTAIGYSLDAAIFEQIEVAADEEEPEGGWQEIESLKAIPAVHAALSSESSSSSSSSSSAGGGRRRKHMLSVALEINGPQHYRLGASHLLNASTQLRKRQLKQFGWHVITISHSRWNQLRNDEVRARWIAEMMPKQLLKDERLRSWKKRQREAKVAQREANAATRLQQKIEARAQAKMKTKPTPTTVNKPVNWSPSFLRFLLKNGTAPSAASSASSSAGQEQAATTTPSTSSTPTESMQADKPATDPPTTTTTTATATPTPPTTTTMTTTASTPDGVDQVQTAAEEQSAKAHVHEEHAH